MKVWVAQCLCPDRHCIMAMTGEAEDEADAQRVRTALRRQVIDWLQKGVVNGWCAICNAHRATWRYELRATRFATMEEAAPFFAETQVQNMAANLLYGDLHKRQRPN